VLSCLPIAFSAQFFPINLTQILSPPSLNAKLYAFCAGTAKRIFWFLLPLETTAKILFPKLLVLLAHAKTAWW
jgi:hypothetical protein